MVNFLNTPGIKGMKNKVVVEEMTPQRTYFVFSKGLIAWGRKVNKPPPVTELINQKFFRCTNCTTRVLKLITNLDSLILKIYFEGAHFCFNTEPKPVQLAQYQSQKKRKKESFT